MAISLVTRAVVALMCASFALGSCGQDAPAETGEQATGLVASVEGGVTPKRIDDTAQEPAALAAPVPGVCPSGCPLSRCCDGECCLAGSFCGDNGCEQPCPPCNGCETCVDGACVPVPAGLDPNNVCPYYQCATGACDGHGACGMWAAGAPCFGAVTCVNNVATGSLCNGAGQCTGTVDCGDKVCHSTGNYFSCDNCLTNADCLNGRVCNPATGNCLRQVPVSGDFHTTPGAACKPAHAADVVAYDEFGISNDGSTAVTVVCPLSLPRLGDNRTDTVLVSVYDKNTTSDVSCTLKAVHADGDVLHSETRTTSGSGFSRLSFSYTPTVTPFSVLLTCALPPPVGVSGRSSVTSIVYDDR